MRTWTRRRRISTSFGLVFSICFLAFFVVRYLDPSSAVVHSSKGGVAQGDPSGALSSPNSGDFLQPGPTEMATADVSTIDAQPLSPAEPSLGGGPPNSRNVPNSNPFAESNGEPISDFPSAPTTTAQSVQPPIPQPPLLAPPSTVPQDLSSAGAPPDCSVRVVTFTEKDRARRIVQVAVRNDVPFISIKVVSGLKAQAQGLLVIDHYAETTLANTNLPIGVFVFGSESQEATSLGCSTFVEED